MFERPGPCGTLVGRWPHRLRLALEKETLLKQNRWKEQEHGSGGESGEQVPARALGARG